MKKAHGPKKSWRKALRPWWRAGLLALAMQVPIEVGKGLVVDVVKEKARQGIAAIHLYLPIDWDRMTPHQVEKRFTALTSEQIEAEVRVELIQAERKSLEKTLPRRWWPAFGQ